LLIAAKFGAADYIRGITISPFKVLRQLKFCVRSFR